MRSFNKKEIQKILAKAAELEMSKSLNDRNEQLTEEEILSLAKESGISASSIKTALHSYDSPEFDTTFKWLKGTTRIQHLEEYGTPLQSEHIAKVLRMFQSNESELGKTELHPKKLTWSINREVESTQINLYEKNGRSTFEYESDWTPLKFILATFPFLILFIITLIVTKGMGFDKYTSLTIAPFGGFIGLAGGWFYLKNKYDQQKRKLNEALLQLRSLFVNEDLDENRIQLEEEQSNIEQPRKNKVSS